MLGSRASEPCQPIKPTAYRALVLVPDGAVVEICSLAAADDAEAIAIAKAMVSGRAVDGTASGSLSTSRPKAEAVSNSAAGTFVLSEGIALDIATVGREATRIALGV